MGRYRVWREDWATDQFQVISKDDFAYLTKYIESINRIMGSTVIMLKEQEDAE